MKPSVQRVTNHGDGASVRAGVVDLKDRYNRDRCLEKPGSMSFLEPRKARLMKVAA
jgi:hypothetical protein